MSELAELSEQVPQQNQAFDTPIELSEYETFKAGLWQIMSVPKTEIDNREAEYQKQQQQKKQAKKAG